MGIARLRRQEFLPNIEYSENKDASLSISPEIFIEFLLEHFFNLPPICNGLPELNFRSLISCH